jgi:hypothetical protein
MRKRTRMPRNETAATSKIDESRGRMADEHSCVPCG